MVQNFKYFWLVLVVSGVLGAQNASLTAQSQEIRLTPIETDTEFPAAAATNSLRLACSADPGALRRFISARGLPFRPDLVRQTATGSCHIFYQPTVPGFRADSSDRPIRELFFSVETVRFLTGSETRVGGVLDVAKQVLSAVSGSLDVSLGVQFPHLAKWYQPALETHFSGTQHRIRLRDEPGARSFPWAQDYLKSGRVNQLPRILVPRRLFEDTPDFGVEFTPLLEALAADPFLRSQLSWEGGDVQFVPHPRIPGRLVMLVGTSAKKYWGKSLSDAEYSYVMQQEFGADEVVILPQLTGHIDYATAFLPDRKTALVSEIMVGNQDLARAAIRMLRARFPRSQPLQTLELARQLEVPAEEFRRNPERLREALQKIQRSPVEWDAELDGDLVEKLNLFVDVNCRKSLEECFTLKAQERLMESDPRLLAKLISTAVEVSSDTVFPQALLSVIESQIPGYRPRNARQLDGLAGRLTNLGFRVIRVPKIAGEQELDHPWSGISYTNLLVVNDLLLVPRFGFGLAEDQIFEHLQAQLPPPFRVVPVDARRVLLFNGGIHCVTGIIYGEEAAGGGAR